MKKHKRKLISLIIAIFTFIIVYFQVLHSPLKTFILEINMTEKNVTKIVSLDELYSIELKQRELGKTSNSEIISDATDKLRDSWYFMDTHPEYDLVEFEFLVKEYVDNGEIIKFISDKGIIKRVYTNNRWESWNDT